MRMAKKFQRKDRKGKLNYLVDWLERKYHYHPGKRYNLLVRTPHETPADYPEYQDDPGQGLLKRNEHWEQVKPNRDFLLPRKRDAPGRTSIHDIATVDDFKNWFKKKYPNLPDGVYGAMQRAGKGQGFNTLFVVEYRGGKITKFQKKSKSQKDAGVGTSAKYFALPWYLRMRDKTGLT